MEEDKMREGDVNLQVIRSLPFWPVMSTCFALVFMGGGIYYNVINLNAQLTDTKNIALGISGKMNKMQIEQAEDRIRTEVLAHQVIEVKGEVVEIKRDVWKLQQLRAR